MALPPLRFVFCATCGVTFMFRHSLTKSLVSNALSAPTVTRCTPGICSNINIAACRSAVPVAGDFRSDDESVAVLCQQISVVTEFGFLATAFACQQRVWIGGGSMRLVAALLTMEVHRRVPFGTGPFDPLTFAAIVALLATSSLAACYLPARSAMRVDPIVALRAEWRLRVP